MLSLISHSFDCLLMQTVKSKKNLQGKKNQQAVQINKNDAESPRAIISSRSGSCISEDDSSGSQEPIGGSDAKDSALNSSGKARAGRGAATDPQSLYARVRTYLINHQITKTSLCSRISVVLTFCVLINRINLN